MEERTCDVIIKNRSEVLKLMIGQGTDNEDDTVEHNFPKVLIFFVEDHEQSFKYHVEEFNQFFTLQNYKFEGC